MLKNSFCCSHRNKRHLHVADPSTSGAHGAYNGLHHMGPKPLPLSSLPNLDNFAKSHVLVGL